MRSELVLNLFQTCSKLIQHAQVNAFCFKRTLGTRIHYVPPTRSSQVAVVILLFLLEYIFFTLSSEMTKGKPRHTVLPVANKEGCSERLFSSVS